MNQLKNETVQAIKADEFAAGAIKAARDFIYCQHRDWSHIDRKGRRLFDCDEAGIAWLALGMLIEADPDDVPNEGRAMVGGVNIPFAAVHALDDAFRAHAKSGSVALEER